MKSNWNNPQEVLENYKATISEIDVEGFLSSYSSDILIYDCWNNWKIEGIFQWRKVVTEWFEGLTKSDLSLDVEWKDLIMEESDHIAFTHGIVTYIEDTGESMTLRLTLGFRKEKDSSWYIVHEHTSLPIHYEAREGIFS